LSAFDSALSRARSMAVHGCSDNALFNATPLADADAAAKYRADVKWRQHHSEKRTSKQKINVSNENTC